MHGKTGCLEGLPMCKAFSCIVGRDKKVTWTFGIDSHEDLIKIAGYYDDTLDPEKIEFCRIEISPKNGSYLDPDEWIFKIDMDITPTWWTLDHQKACEREFRKWKNQLYTILVRKAIVHPFRDIPPPEITEAHIELLKEWASVRASVWASVGASAGASARASVGVSVWASVGASAGASVGASVRASAGDSVWDSVWDSVGVSAGDSVWAYVGSFFILERPAWKYTEGIERGGYPFQSAVTLWETGLVPSFDGEKGRLHGGREVKILWEGEL